MENSNGKKTMGRRKIEIKKIEKKTSRQVTFAKRRGGLFRKASELALLCGAEVAIITQSPGHKIYSFGHPSVEALLNRLSLSPVDAETEAEASLLKQKFEEERRKLEEAEKKLEMEKTREAALAAASESEKKDECWWDQPIEGMELHELEEYCTALEALGEKVDERLKEFEILNNTQLSAAPQNDFAAFSSNLGEKVGERLKEFEEFNNSQLSAAPQNDFAASSYNFGEKVDERLKEFEEFNNSQSAAPQNDFAASSSNSVQFDGLFTDWDDDNEDLYSLIKNF